MLLLTCRPIFLRSLVTKSSRIIYLRWSKMCISYQDSLHCRTAVRTQRPLMQPVILCFHNGDGNGHSTSFGDTDSGAVSAAISLSEMGWCTEWVVRNWQRYTRQGCNISPAKFNRYAGDIGLRTMERIRTRCCGRPTNINNLRYANDTTCTLKHQWNCYKRCNSKAGAQEQCPLCQYNQKTKLMVAGRNDDRVKIVVECDIIEKVESSSSLDQ